MSVPTLAGQYRRVRHTDDGCYMYQCLWCHNCIETRDDPAFYAFCPKCGKSWFKRLECRDHDMPRWVYDRYGKDYPHDLPFYIYKQSKYRILIEERTRWPGRPWGEWKYETHRRVDFGRLGVWRDAQYYLNMLRARAARDPDDEANDGFGFGILYEYRARLDKLK